jgi:hypothetical protein
MNEDAKYGRETMNKVLGWGAVVYFLVLGYSLNQHALFELYPAEEQIQLEKAKIAYAETLEAAAAKRPPTQDPEKSAKEKADAAQARLDVRILQDDRRDSHERARNLIIGVLVFGLGYFIAIPIFYYVNVSRYGAKYFIPIWLATLYGLVLGAVTFYVAYKTAIQ